MRWRGRRESDNVEDRRAESGGSGGFGFPFPRGGGGMRFPGAKGSRARKGGIGGIGLIVVLGLMLLFGVDPSVIFQGAQQGQRPAGFPEIRLPQSGTQTRTTPARRGGSEGKRPRSASDDDLKRFVSVVLADTEDVWNGIFREYGKSYKEPKLVLFSGSTGTGCGYGQAAMGPFYCPLDKNVYIDLTFYRELKTRFSAPGDFAQAYVIAHEVGHHVQTLLGISEKVQSAKQRMGKRDGNALQVRMELQADCLAGVWANRAQRTKKILEPGDIDEALNAASAIGDDTIQKQTQGRVVPDAFTHGSAEQRQRWFKRGFEAGDLQKCDTFNASQL
ncbi:MAG: KPN_02809 family neutral zinc metallopeptidase [Methyloligellaceae bacterium]